MNTTDPVLPAPVSKNFKKPAHIVVGSLIFMSAVFALVSIVQFGAPAPAVAAAYLGFQAPAPVNSSAIKITANAETRLSTFTLEPATPPPFYDFMVPDVCLDASGNVTSEDPAKCTKKRNLRIGESIPYIISDFAGHPDWNQAYSYAPSFPVIHGKEVRVIQFRDFGANSGHSSTAFRDFDKVDGGDILSSNGEYVSAIGTRDPKTNKSGFVWAQPDCSLKDSWTFFPNTLTKGGDSYNVAKLIGMYLPCVPSPDAYSISLTNYHWYTAPLPYTSNKQLETIQSWHHSGTSTDPFKNIDSMEVFRFTKEYGLTRWEGWTALQGSMPNHMEWETPEEVTQVVNDTKKSGICNQGDPLDRYGYMLYRWGCRDWSFIFAPDAKRGPLTPYTMPLVKEFVTSRNLISADEDRARADAAGGSLLGWKTLALGGGKGPKLSAGYDASTSKNLPTTDTPTPGNGFYKLECTDACGSGNPRSMYLDVNPNDAVKDYGTGALTVQVGGLVRGPAKAMNGTLAVHLMDSRGAIMATRSASLSVASTSYAMKVTAFSTTTASSTSPARLNVHWDGGTTYKNIPYGAQVLIGDKVYPTISGTTVGLIYLSATTTGLKVGDPIKHIQGPDGKVIYSDVGATPGTAVWNQVRFNFDWDFTAKPVSNIRYELYVRSPGEYHLDEAFTALLPRN